MAEPFAKYIHPDDLEDTIAVIGEISGGKEVINFENRIFISLDKFEKHKTQ